VDHRESAICLGESVQDFPCFILRAIVDRDDFEARVVLRE
jgi:hypothetical protein